MFIITLQKWTHLYFLLLIYTPQNPFGFTRVPQNIRPQTYCFQFFSAITNQGCTALDTVLSPRYSSMPQKKSPLKARVGKNTKIRKTTGDAIPAQACADFMWALGAGPLAHRLAAGEEQSPSLAYKYICELCDSVGTPSSSSLLDGLCLQRSLRCGFCKCHLLHLCCFLPSCRVWFLLCSIHLLLPLNATFLSSPFSFS